MGCIVCGTYIPLTTFRYSFLGSMYMYAKNCFVDRVLSIRGGGGSSSNDSIKWVPSQKQRHKSYPHAVLFLQTMIGILPLFVSTPVILVCSM